VAIPSLRSFHCTQSLWRDYRLATLITICLKPRNRRVAHAVRSADIHQWLAGLAPRNGLPNLEWRELGLAAKPDATFFGSLPAFIRPSSDQVTFEGCQAT